MELTHNEIEKLKKEIKDEILNIVVTKEECNDVQGSVNKKLFNDDKRIEIITHDFAVVKKLMRWVSGSHSTTPMLRATSISAHLHEAIMARQERIIRRLSYALALSAISNLLIVCAVVFHV